MANRATVEMTATNPAPDARGAERVDVLIVGAGLSGIGAAYHLQTECPSKSYAILEGRNASGGTWDLFRYPGVRSDSDMYTLGFRFRPWREAKAIADGSSILKYLRDTAQESGIDQKIRYGHQVTRASWSSADALWTVETTGPEGKPVQFVCSFLYMCSGYYDYSGGYMPGWPVMDRFRGSIVHPQKWPENLDYSGKRVVVIGSGATAVTLVQKELGPEYDIGKHFSPRYNPWDQRLCLVPDSDLFTAIRSGKASITTDEIESFTENGLRLRSGDELEADIIVTATGLKLKMLGGMEVLVDGVPVDLAHVLSYKGMMYSDIP